MHSNIQSYTKNFTNKFRRTDAKRRNSIQNLKKDASSFSGDIQLSLNYDLEEEIKLINDFNIQKRVSITNIVLINPSHFLEYSTKLRPIRTTKIHLVENTEKIISKLEAYNASYNKDFGFLKSKFDGCNRIHLQNQTVIDESTGNDAPVYEISLENDCSSSGDITKIWEGQLLNNIQSDPLITGLLNDLSSEAAEIQSSKLRHKSRQSTLFNLYTVQDLDKQIEYQTTPEYPKESVGKSIKIHIKSFKLEFDVEPIFGMMCLYDLKTRKKISENFYFDFNDSSKFQMLDEKSHHSFVNRLPQANSCIFHVDNLSDIFLVIRIEKILQQGDVNEIADSYLKDEKHKSKMKTQIEWSCKNLAKYRMPFGIYAMPLYKDIQNNTFQSSNSIDSCSINSGSFSIKSSKISTNSKRHPLENNSTKSASQSQSKDMFLMTSNSIEDDEFDVLQNNFKTSIKTITYFYRQESDKMSEDDLFKWFIDLKKPGSNNKKIKPIPCNMELEISQIDELISNEFILSPEHMPLATKYQSPRSSKKQYTNRPIMDILEFPAEKRFIANAIYRNLLYVYPKSINFNSKQGSLRNIAIRIQFFQLDGDKPKLLKNIYDKCNGPKFISEAFTKVIYHNKNPDCHDEIKIQLPGRVTNEYYLLFTFYHVSCQSNKKSDGSPIETIIGYSWLPLLENEILHASEHSLLVSTEKPSSKNLLKKPDLQSNIENVHWIENHRELFKVFILPISTVHSEDAVIEKFNNAASNIRFNPNSVELELDKINLIESLKKIDSSPLVGLVQYSSIIFDNLLWLSLCPNNSMFPEVSNIHQHFLNVLATLVNRFTNQSIRKNDNTNRDSILVTYVTYAACLPGLTSESDFQRSLAFYNKIEKNENKFNSDDAYLNPENYQFVTGLFHEDFLSRILQCIDAGIYENIIDNLWFFLELLIRGMKDYFYFSNNLRKLDQKLVFSELFLNKLIKLARFATQQIDRYFKDYEDFSVGASNQPKKCQTLIRNLAFFYRDLLTLLNSDFIRFIIVDFFEMINSRIETEKKEIVRFLILLKLEFLRIISDSEFFLNLNGLEIKQLNLTINSQFSDYHIVTNFFLQLLLTELKLCLKSCDIILESTAAHIIWNLIASHESDSRYRDPIIKSNISNLYLPFVSILFDVIKYVLASKGSNCGKSSQHICSDNCSSISLDCKSVQNTEIMDDSLEDDTDNPNAFESMDLENSAFITENSRHLLLCFIWILKNLDTQLLKKWLKSLTPDEINRLLHIMMLTAVNFEFKSYKDNRSKMLYDNLKCSSIDILNSNDCKKQINSSSRRLFVENSLSIMEGKLCMEVILIILDSLDLIIKSRENNQDLSSEIIIKIFKMIIRCLELNQSVSSIQSILAFQRLIIKKYYKKIFDEAINLCGDLCNNLLRLAGSGLKETRSHAVASLYMLMRYNFQLDNTFARIKLQITMALSKLVWDREDSKHKRTIELNLNSSLRTIIAYTAVEMDLQQGQSVLYDDSIDYTSFANQVEELMLNLHTILTDTVKMRQFEEDPEMQIDLMSRIAKGYQNSPDLRLSWLQRMVQKHKKLNNKAEAGMCLAHCAAIVAEYLGMKEPLPYMPVGCVQLSDALGPNLLEESAISDDVVGPDEDGVCCDKLFSQDGLIELIRRTAKYFIDAYMFELIPKMYRVVLPILEERSEFPLLSKFHNEIKDAYDSIQNNVDKRIFATYFRIGFYGDGFKELNNQEFIYKEPPCTKLPEISSRIETFYVTRFGKDKVHMVKDSNIVNLSTLEKDKMYIQITFVEPYFEMAELRRRKSKFDQNHNLKNFVFSTPYTLDGKAHGELKDQYKRKTILTTEKAFPYIKTRIRVIHKYQIDLTPIEVALEDLSRKVDQLSWVLSKHPIDVKYLQMMLQGSIGTTVNQGPLELATSFLSSNNKVNRVHYNKLRLCFKEFLRRCQEGLSKNNNLITQDQKEYQNELEKNFKEISKQLNPLLNVNM